MQLQQYERTLIDLDIAVVIVTFETRASAREYVREAGVRWTVLVDETRSLYRAYGMLRGRWWNILGPRTWWAYAKELMLGQWPRPSHADPAQLGGDVLVDPEGTVRYLHVGSGPADRPSVEAILRARQPTS